MLCSDLDLSRTDAIPPKKNPGSLANLLKTADSWYIVAMAKSSRANTTNTIPTCQKVELASPPPWIKPQLAKLVDEAPDGSDGLHELKLDGYRMHARLDA